MRFSKYKGPEISRIEAHNERTKETYASNPDIDTSRTHLNTHLVVPPQHYRVEAERQIREANCRVRSDSIRLVEVLFSVSTGYFDGKSPEDIRAYYQRSLDFLCSQQDERTILSATIHMDEATPHMHVVFVPLTPDHRLSAKEILGNRKKLIQWQDRYYEYMSARYPDLSRGESAAQTKRQHMDTQEYKAMTAEIRKMTRLADKITHLLDGANLLNAKGRLEEIVPLIRKLLPRIGKMKTQLEQYAQAFTAITEENKALKKENEQLDTDVRRERQKALDSRFELGRLQEQARRLEQKLARIPPEILAQYSKSAPRQEQNRNNQPFL